MNFDNLEGKKILITGINGFVGINLAQACIRNDCEVVGVATSQSTKDKDITDLCKMYYGSVCDYDFIRKVISSNEIDIVVHLAATSIVRVSAADPMSNYETNIMGTVNVLEACRTVGHCERIIVASSDKAYGDQIAPYKEDMPLLPSNPYDVSKAAMDLIAQSYATNYGMPVIVTRCSNVYGIRDRNYSRIIPNTIRRLLSGKKPILYSGAEEMQREFIFIADVVQAYLHLMSTNKLNNIVYNIGTNSPIYIDNLVKKICGTMCLDEAIEFHPKKHSFKEIQTQCMLYKRITDDTGWVPTCDLDYGISLSFDWYKKELDK